MKTMCPPGYHHSGFAATRALGHVIYKAIVVITERAHCFNDCICTTLILLLCDLSTVCIYTYVYIHMCIHICIHTYIHYIYIYIYIYIYMNVYVCICVYVYACVCVFACVCVCVCVS